jgi:hypothetical protein
MRLVYRLFLVVLVLGVAVPGFAQSRPKASNPNATFNEQAVIINGPAPQTYGTSANTFLALTAWDAHPIDSSFTYTYSNNVNGGQGISQSNSSGNPWVHAPVHLPAGALVSSFEMNYCDTNASAILNSWFVVDAKNGGTTYNNAVLGTANVGCVVSTAVFSPAIQIDNNNNSYYVEVNMGSTTDQSIILGSIRLGYVLQVSPAPGTATFTDVPTTHPQFKFVEALVAAGITAGCGGGNYCPDQALTRGQMAVYLSVALGLHWPN